jgi:tetratricopeptide (TPR) repeat protein
MILIVSVARLMLRSKRRGRLEDSRDVALTWGVFVACLSVGIHSVMDFELSLPGIAMQLWAAFGLVYESTMGTRIRRDVAVRQNNSAPAIALVVLSVGIIAPSLFLIRGASYGSLGASALFRQDFHTSVRAYQMARNFDPLTASYSIDMGQAYAAMALLEGEGGHKQRALAELATARNLEPYNLSHRQKEVEILVSLGEAGMALDVSRQVLESVPLDMQAYESFAKLSVVNYIATESDGLLGEVVALPDRLTELLNKVVGLYREKWDPLKLEPSSCLNTYIGQAYYLRGELDVALSFFDRAIAKDKSAEAQMWKTATQILLGQIPQAGTSPDVLRIVSYFHPNGG